MQARDGRVGIRIPLTRYSLSSSAMLPANANEHTFHLTAANGEKILASEAASPRPALRPRSLRAA